MQCKEAEGQIHQRELASIEKMLPADWSVSKSVVHCLD